MIKVLLTGAAGYIGRRLKNELLKNPDIQLRAFVRYKQALSCDADICHEVVEGSTFDKGSLAKACQGIDVAYYLIHSLESKDFRRLDKESAQNFLDACIEAGVKRIIYLGGLGDKQTASEHLISRIETGEVLSAQPQKVQCVWFRAGVIIGSGSASFEIIRHLMQKLPVMITPKWVNTPCQPIAGRDVISYLAAAATLETKQSVMVDIGSDRLTYGQMMIDAGQAMGLRRFLIPVPLLSPKLSSYWLTLFTPVPLTVASSLIEGLRSPVVATNENAKKFFPAITPMPYKEAVKMAMDEIEANQVVSRWSDRSNNIWEMEPNNIAAAVYFDRQKLPLGDLRPDSVFRAFTKVGGSYGWYGTDFLWSIRGLIDKLFGGYGTNRGRRSESELRVGDSVDFWKVVDIEENRRFLLFAQMKVPGKAWLEFLIDDGVFIQTAYFLPKGVLGRLYWFVVLPFHRFVFPALSKGIIKEATRLQKGE